MKEKIKKLMKTLTKKLTKKRLIILLIVIVVISAIGLKFSPKKTDESAFLMQSEVEVTRGNIEESMSKTGTIESAVFKIVKPNKSGTVEETFVTDGAKVVKGEKLLKINYDEVTGNLSDSHYSILQLREEIEDLIEKGEKYNIKAPDSGVITEIAIEKSDELSIGDKIARIINRSTMSATLQFTKDKVFNIQVGDQAEIVLPQYLTQLTGVVTKVSDVGYGLDNGGIAYDVEVEFPNEGGLIEGVLINGSIVKGSNKLTAIQAVTAKWKSDEIIYSEVEGEITSINYQENQQVDKDAVIVKIADDDYKDKLNMEQKKLANLETTYEKDKKRFDDHIYAPVEGTIVDMSVVSGENITSDTTIATIVDLDNYQITIPVDEKYILKVEEGKEAIIKVDAIEGLEFNGIIKKVFKIGKHDGGNTTYNVMISLNQHDELEKLRIGMNAKVKVVLAAKQNVLLVPIDYISAVGDDYFVNIKQEDETTEEVSVSIGIASSDFVEVEGNLKEGDIVIK